MDRTRKRACDRTFDWVAVISEVVVLEKRPGLKERSIRFLGRMTEDEVGKGFFKVDGDRGRGRTVLADEAYKERVLLMRVQSSIVGDTFQVKNEHLEVGNEDNTIHKGGKEELGPTNFVRAINHLNDGMGRGLSKAGRV